MHARKAFPVHLGLDAFVHGEADAFVKVALRAGQLDILHDLGLGREFLHHFLFAPPQNERGNAAGQQFAAFVVFALLDGPAKN